MSFELILPFLRPIEPLLLDDSVKLRLLALRTSASAPRKPMAVRRLR